MSITLSDLNTNNGQPLNGTKGRCWFLQDLAQGKQPF